MDEKTLRALAAIQAMNGIITNLPVKMSVSEVAKLAVEQADALMKKLK